MSDYDLGVQLRRQILLDLERGLSTDGRRLQALLGDFCADRQAVLLPALKYLVLSAGFSNAVAQQPPLPADGRLQLRLQQELDQVFAAAICGRMDAVLRGLLGLPADSSAASIPEPSAPITAESPPHEPSGNNGGLVALLGFIAGVLVVGVGGGLAWLWLQNGQPASTPQQSEQAASREPSQPAVDPVTSTAPSPPDLSGADLSRATASVQQLYDDLSLGNLQGARQRFSGTAADQFDPAFFRQFQRVSVDNLQETGRDGATIHLQGVVTFVYPDGTSQSESRSFTVDTNTDPALITASSFIQVLQGRR